MLWKGCVLFIKSGRRARDVYMFEYSFSIISQLDLSSTVLDIVLSPPISTEQLQRVVCALGISPPNVPMYHIDLCNSALFIPHRTCATEVAGSAAPGEWPYQHYISELPIQCSNITRTTLKNKKKKGIIKI